MRRLSASLLALALLASGLPAAAADDWRLAGREDGIELYTRAPEGSANIAFRGVVTLAHPPAAVLAVLEDVDRYPDWYARCRSARSVERHPPDWRIVRMEIDLPFPASDRDAVVRVDRDQEGETLVLRISTAADAVPEVPGFVRMPRVEGGWRLEPVPGGTRVVYEQLNDPGGRLPAWLTNLLATDQPARTLAGLRRVLDRRRPRGAQDPAQDGKKRTLPVEVHHSLGVALVIS